MLFIFHSILHLHDKFFRWYYRLTEGLYPWKWNADNKTPLVRLFWTGLAPVEDWWKWFTKINVELNKCVKWIYLLVMHQAYDKHVVTINTMQIWLTVICSLSSIKVLPSQIMTICLIRKFWYEQPPSNTISWVIKDHSRRN